MTPEEQKAVEEFTEMNLTKKGLYHYNDMQDAFLIGLFKGEKMQPPLSSNLDEAAEEYGRKEYSHAIHFWDEGLSKNKPEVMKEDFVDAFKAGAEWMAGQGVTVDGIIIKVGYKLDVETTEYILPEESVFERGDKVIVQIRKKQ